MNDEIETRTRTMIGSRGERALSTLFDEIKERDAHLEPPVDLEERMMARLSRARSPRASRPIALPVSAAAMLAVAIGLAVWAQASRPEIAIIAPANTAPAGTEPTGKARTDLDSDVPMFLALRPDAHEMLTESGSVQVARVRVSREVLADLGVVIDGDRVGEPMQADVLFGEDGMARAIRLVPVSGRTEW